MTVETTARSPVAQPSDKTSGEHVIPAGPWAARLSPRRMFVVPLAFTLSLVGLALLAPVRQNPKLLSAFLGAAVALCAWTAVLLASALRRGRTLTLELLLRKQHYL